MTLRGEQTISATTRFTTFAREFAIEASFVGAENAITTSLYENGRLLFSYSTPALDSVVAGNLEAALDESAKILEAQVTEMYASLEDVEKNGSSQTMCLLADVFESRGLFDEAERLYSMAADLNPAGAECLYQHGLCLTQLGEYGQAAEKFAAAVELKPLYADYRNAYGLALAWSGKIAESRKQLDQALELNTYYAEAYYSSGLVCLFNGIKNIDKQYAQDFVARSKSLFEKAILIDDVYATDEYERAMGSLSSGAVREAFSYFKRNRDQIVRERASSYEHRRTTFLAATQSSGEQAIDAQIASLRQQLADNPNYVDLSFQLAMAYFNSAICQWNSGIEQLKAALEMNPELYKAIRAHDSAFALLADMESATKKMDADTGNQSAG